MLKEELSVVGKYSQRWEGLLTKRDYSFKELLLKDAYKPDISRVFLADEVEIIEDYLQSKVEYSHVDEAKIGLLENRYSIVTDELVEYPSETYMLTAMTLASVEPATNRLKTTLKFFNAMWNDEISVATPILANVRLNKSPMGASCFILYVEDNIQSIASVVKQAMEISSNGGGIGICFDEVRSRGSKIRDKGGKHEGVMSFMSIFNQIANVVNQAGTRKGSITVAVGVHHNDVLDVINMRREFGEETSDFRVKCSDLYNQVIITDEFVKRVIADDYWCTFDPFELRQNDIILTQLSGDAYSQAIAKAEELYEKGVITHVKKYKARYILGQIFQAQATTGFPYLFFKENAVKSDIIDDILIQTFCTNLCTESMTPFSAVLNHSCYLSSVNLLTYLNGARFEQVVKLTVRLLNNLIQLSNNLSHQSKAHVDAFRSIGVGTIGLADLLATKNLKYDDVETSLLVEEIYERLALYSAEASCEYAKKYAVRRFNFFKKSSWSKGFLYNKPLSAYSDSDLYMRWQNLATDIEKFGIANGYLLSIAPNTSTATLTGLSPSWFPRFELEYPLKGYSQTFVVSPKIDRELWGNYHLEEDVNQLDKVGIASIINSWVDQGVSFELFLNLNTVTESDVYEWFIESWKGGVKTWYYMTIKPLEYCEIGCDSCGG